MPYGSFHVSIEESVRNAVRLVKEGGAEAVKVEGGERRIELIARLVEAEIPVMGHVGLTPQSVNAHGRIPRAGKNERRGAAGGARRAGRGSGGSVCRGAGIDAARTGGADHRETSHSHDRHRRGSGLRRPDAGVPRLSVGLTHWATRRNSCGGMRIFRAEISRAVAEYCEDVRGGAFPSDAESYHSAAELREQAPAAPAALNRRRSTIRAVPLLKGATSMNIEDFRLLYEFNAWANQRTLEACAALTPEQFTRDLGSSFQLRARHAGAHLRRANGSGWSAGTGRSPQRFPAAADFPDFEAVRRRWAEIERDLLDYVASLTPEDLQRVIELQDHGRRASRAAAVADACSTWRITAPIIAGRSRRCCGNWERSPVSTDHDRLLPRAQRATGCIVAPARLPRRSDGNRFTPLNG